MYFKKIIKNYKKMYLNKNNKAILKQKYSRKKKNYYLFIIKKNNKKYYVLLKICIKNYKISYKIIR